MKRQRRASTAVNKPFKPPRKVAPVPRSLVFQPNTIRGGPEQKEHVVALPAAMGNFGATTFSAATLLNGLHQGATAATRIGRKITMKSLLIRYSIALAPTSVGGSPARILVVYDKQPNLLTAAITDILLANDFHSPNNLNNSDRFITVFDHISEPISTQNNYSVSGVLYKKLGLETMYKDTDNGDITDITTGSLLAFVACNSGITIATGAVGSLTRMRFIDY